MQTQVKFKYTFQYILNILNIHRLEISFLKMGSEIVKGGICFLGHPVFIYFLKFVTLNMSECSTASLHFGSYTQELIFVIEFVRKNQDKFANFKMNFYFKIRKIPDEDNLGGRNVDDFQNGSKPVKCLQITVKTLILKLLIFSLRLIKRYTASLGLFIFN